MTGEALEVTQHHHDRLHRPGVVGRLLRHVEHLLRPHSHEAADKVDAALEASSEGMRALWISLAVLGVTALGQALIVVWSGSVALLGDTLHNAADALTAVPLGSPSPWAAEPRPAATPTATAGPRTWPAW